MDGHKSNSAKFFANIAAYGLVFALMAVDIFPVWFPGETYIPGLVVHGLAIAGAAIYLFWRSVIRGCALPRSGVEKGLLAFCAAVLLSIVFSPEPRQGLPVIFSILHYALLFYLLTDAMQNSHIRSAVLNALLVLSGILLALAILETYAAYLGWQSQAGFWRVLPPFPYRFTSLLMHANAMMSYLNLLAPLALLTFLREKHFGGRLLRGIWLGFYLLAIPFSSSRGGWLGLATWVGVLLLYWAQRKINFKRVCAMPRRLLSAVGLLIPLILAGAILAGVRFISVFAAHPTHGNNPFGGRADLWLHALQIWLKSPWVGAGAGRTGLEFFTFTPSIPPDYWPFHAHSLYLQVLSDFGAAGLIGFALLLGLFLLQLWRMLRTAEKENFFPLAVFAGAAAWLVHSIFDDLTIWKAVMDQLVVLLACLFACRLSGDGFVSDKTVAKKTWGRGSMNLLWLPLLLLCGWFGWSAWSAHPMQLAAQAALRGDWRSALEGIDTARQRDPTLRYYRDMSGIAGAWLWAQDGDLETLADASAQLEVNRDTPASLSLWTANLAILEWQAGDVDTALRDMQSAEQRAPNEATYPFNLAVMLEMSGQEELALQAYCRTLALRPEWLGHPFWESSDLRREANLNCEAASLQNGAYWFAAQQALLADDLSGAKLNLARSDWARENDLARAITHGLLLEAQGQPEQALAAYENAMTDVAAAVLEGSGKFAVSYASYFQRPALPVDLVPGYHQLQQDVGQFAAMQKLAEAYRQQGDKEKLAWIEDLFQRAVMGELVGY